MTVPPAIGHFFDVKRVTVRGLAARLRSLFREVVAERRPSLSEAPTDIDARLESLAAQGLITLGLAQDPDAYQRTGVHLLGDSQDLLDEERGER